MRLYLWMGIGTALFVVILLTALFGFGAGAMVLLGQFGVLMACVAAENINQEARR